MDVTYSIDIENMKKLIAQCPQVFADEALQLLREVVTVLEGKVVEHTPVGVGGEAGLRGSISSDAYIRAREIVGTVGTPLPMVRWLSAAARRTKQCRQLKRLFRGCEQSWMCRKKKCAAWLFSLLDRSEKKALKARTCSLKASMRLSPGS